MKLASVIAPRFRQIVGASVRDPDVEQAWLRVIVCVISFGYLWYLVIAEGAFTPGLTMGFAASVGDALVGAGMIWWMRGHTLHRVPLRYLGIVSDNTALTLGMAGAGESGVAMIGVYLWVTIGNGFRFGPRFLMASYWASIVGFGLQLLFVPFWAQHQAIGVGLMLAGAVVPLYVLVLLIRLTAQKDAAEQLSNAKSRFVANVSHELRTPLTGVFAVYDILRNRKMVPDDRQLIGMLGSSISTLKASVDAVLQMSKLEAGSERAENKPFNLWYLLHQVAALVRPQSAAKGLAWTIEVHPGVPITVSGDVSHLSHALGNLLNNAFKFTHHGGVTLRAFGTADGTVRFEVTDTGIGISLDHQEHLFERFVQVDNSSTRRYGGTGLGTSIARDLVELMGGKIGVISAPGKGSTFWAELPLVQATQQPDAEWGTRRKVLIVGHESELGAMAIPALQRAGLEVVLGADSVHDVRELLSRNAGGLLAALFVMSPSDAISYSEEVLPSGSVTCPWIVIADGCGDGQRAALVRTGCAAILDVPNRPESLLVTLGGLRNRLDLPDSAQDTTPESGIVSPLEILLADDNRSNQLLLSKILRDAGHNVTVAESGGAAFDIMGAEKIDLAILDLNMPDMSGPDVIKLFRASSIGADRLPIMVLSADATPVAKQESLDAGADEFVTKPVTTAALLATIERMLAGAASRGEPVRNIHNKGKAVSAKPQGEAPRSIQSATSMLVDTDRIAAVRRIARGDVKFLDTYVNAAFSELEQAIEDLRLAVRRKDSRAARDFLHIIEGTGASVGAVALVANCKSIREYIDVPDDPDRASALAELSTTYTLTKSTVLASLHSPRESASRTGAKADKMP